MIHISKIIFSSIRYYRKKVLNQVIIIILLCAVITGSLLTGFSVMESLRKTAAEHLGNAGYLISSGNRYFDAALSHRLKDSLRLNCTGLLETNSFCKNINSQKEADNVHLYAIDKNFFSFQGSDTIHIKEGEVLINAKLAEYLGLKKGDDLIIKYKSVSDIPADAPFAPDDNSEKSAVVRIGRILGQGSIGNFSLSVSQITQMNAFLNLNELENDNDRPLKINRLLINHHSNTVPGLVAILKKNIRFTDIGLKLRHISKTGENELISDRVFIDKTLIDDISHLMPSSYPVLTYLGNRFDSGKRMTPYSFVSAIPGLNLKSNEIAINKWMAGDLQVSEGDTIKMSWYSPDSLNNLVERSGKFKINRIVNNEGIWSDSLLMPPFPGISGKDNCSDWDAGVEIKMKLIRPKDEDYWKHYRGTPKAFINYDSGKVLWGNNFGPATSLRFPVSVSEKDIMKGLNEALDPFRTGFVITDLSDESAKAADESIDFGSLFISLGFFLILSAFILLSFAVTSYFEQKKIHLYSLYAAGFRNSYIYKILLYETVIISFVGCLFGSIAGYYVNAFITKALNTVWIGAVQTNTIKSYFSIWPVVSGFGISFLTIMLLMFFMIRKYLKTLYTTGKSGIKYHTGRISGWLIITSFIISVVLFAAAYIYSEKQLMFSFISGAVFLFASVSAWRFYFAGGYSDFSKKLEKRSQLSQRYYSFRPSVAITPLLFIAAGLFTVFITGANKMIFSGKQTIPSGGTGGYILWCETSLPVKEDLNSVTGRRTTGLDSDEFGKVSFVQMKKLQGNDASCLNLNHITAPPLLGTDPRDFIARGSFSFSTVIKDKSISNPWDYLQKKSDNDIVYGIADQTVLEWGLKLHPGDTLKIRAENGKPLKIVIAAGLKSSVFQGFMLISKENFNKYFPSVSGSSVMLVDGPKSLTDSYEKILGERLENYGIRIEKTTDRLAAFYEVTNTYLMVFGVFGALGMITGVAGLGFVLMRNYRNRKNEFALMLATGFHIKQIRKMILKEQVLILSGGISSGIASALISTLPSLRSNSEIPWLYLTIMVAAIILTGLLALFFSVRSINTGSLVISLRKE